MRATDLTKALKSYKSGWVAIDKKQKVVASAKSFGAISDRVKNRKDIFLMPASADYCYHLGGGEPLTPR